jgi:O-antigen ligase
MQRLLVVLLVLTVALCPLPLGSNRDWAWDPLAAIVGALLVATAALALVDREWQQRALGPFRALLVPAVLFGLVVVWGLVQLSGWTPASWASSLSASATLGLAETSRAVAFDSGQQWTALQRLLTYGGVFVLAAALGAYAPDARRLLGAIVVVATLMTLYSMAADAINGQAQFTGISLWTPFNPFFSGTFVNANNYADYAGLSAMAALVLAFRPGSRQEGRESSSERWRRRLAVLTGMSGLWFALAIILFMGVFLSGSRAGLVSLALALITMVAFHTRGSVRTMFVLLVPLAILALIILTPGGDRLLEKSTRFVSQGVERDALYQVTLGAIALRPMIGWGMNSFEELYSVFQPASIVGNYDKAHNTYLELAFDLGIPAASALMLAVVWVAWRAAIGFGIRGRDRELAGLGVYSTVLVAFHSLFDFGLQIPAVTCTFVSLLGVAWAQSWSSRQFRRGD